MRYFDKVGATPDGAGLGFNDNDGGAVENDSRGSLLIRLEKHSRELGEHF